MNSLVFSVMGGYVDSIGTFNSPTSESSVMAPPQNSQATFTGGTVGVSATYINTGFFVDALFKADFLTMKVGNLPGSVCTPGSGQCGPSAFSTTLGIIGNIGYRWEAGRYFIEPIGSVQWSSNRIDNITLPSAQVVEQFGHNDRIDVGGGLRAGGVIMDDRIHYLEGSVIGRVWDTVTSANQVSFANLGPTFTLQESLFTKLYGEAGFQLDWLNRLSGWSAFLRVDEKFNDQFQIFTGKGGLRYGF